MIVSGVTQLNVIAEAVQFQSETRNAYRLESLGIANVHSCCKFSVVEKDNILKISNAGTTKEIIWKKAPVTNVARQFL